MSDMSVGYLSVYVGLLQKNIHVEFDDNEDVIEYKCNKCDSRSVSVMAVQRRSADEPADVIIRCFVCHSSRVL